MIKPDYKENSFNQIIPTIEYFLSGKSKNKRISNKLLDKKRYNKVILILVDAFGWCFWKKFKKDIKFLKETEKNGIILKLSSQFPSTTTAQITTILTDTPLIQHGMYEWRYFEPKMDEIIIPFKFSLSSSKRINSLKKKLIDPKEIYPTENFYDRFKKNDITSYYFINKFYLKTPYNEIITKGSNFIPTNDWSDTTNKLVSKIKKNEKAYYFLYIDGVDTVGHEFGPDSKEFKNEIIKSFRGINNLFKKIKETKNTLLVITADHGMSPVNPKTTIYLNKIFPSIRKYLKRNEKGDLLVPAGGPRDMFLYVKEEYLDELKDKLNLILKNKAEVYKTKDLLKQKFFGDREPSKKFLGRLGNLVILPRYGESVWWYKKGVFEQKYFGHHGGLVKEEMEIPLILIPIN